MTNEWDGKGLPPIGCFVEFCNKPSSKEDICIDEWMEGDKLEVISHKSTATQAVAIVWNERDHTSSGVVEGHMRPLKSQADIEREEAIEKIATIYNGADTAFQYECFGELYDKGYRLMGEKVSEKQIGDCFVGESITDGVDRLLRNFIITKRID